jgi:hypothetical protein
LTLGARAVEEARAELAGQDPHRRIQRRLLEFAPLERRPLPADVELPSRFVAARGVGVDVVEPVVHLEHFDAETAQAVVARAGAYVGPYGVEPYLAVLLGVPAVALGTDRAGADELRLARTFLAEPPFGPLDAVAADASPAEIAARVARHLRPEAISLAPAG